MRLNVSSFFAYFVCLFVNYFSIVNLLLLDCFVIVGQLNRTSLVSTPAEIGHFHIQPTMSLTVFSCSPRYFVYLQ